MRCWWWGFVVASVGCGDTGGENASSESHWVMCSVDVDCLSHVDAMGCSAGGVCVDDESQPIEVVETSANVGSLQVADAPQCDPLDGPVLPPAELGLVLAAGEDGDGVTWVFDYLPDPDAPTCSGLSRLCSPTPLRAFRSEADTLVRMRLRYDFNDRLDQMWPELYDEHTEVLQVALTADQASPDSGARGVVALATADGQVVMGSYAADATDEPEQPIATPGDMLDVFTPVDESVLRESTLIDFVPRSRVTRHAGFEGSSGQSYVLLLTTPEADSEARRLFFGTAEETVQRRIEQYAVAADGGTIALSFWADTQLVEAYLPHVVNPLSGIEGEPTITIDGTESELLWIDEGADVIGAYVVHCGGW